MSSVWVVFRETRTETPDGNVYRDDLIAVCSSEYHAKQFVEAFEYREDHHYTVGLRTLTANSEDVNYKIEREGRTFPELVRK